MNKWLLSLFIKTSLGLLNFFQSTSLADTIHENLIFAESKYAGAILCTDLEAGGYCETAVNQYDSSGKNLNKKILIQGACIQGGGDCLMVVFALKTKPADTQSLYALVNTTDKKETWIKFPKNSFKSVEEWVPKLETGANQIVFRPDFKFVYLDKELTKKLPITEITKLPEGKERNHTLEEIEYLEINSFLKDKQKIIEIQVNLITKEASLLESDPLEAIAKGKRKKIRTFFFPAFDNKDRINYWYLPQSC